MNSDTLAVPRERSRVGRSPDADESARQRAGRRHHSRRLLAGRAGPIDPLLLLNACVGTALVAGGAAAINQVSERDIDRLMVRTRRRPLADARMPVVEAVALALGLTAVGLVMLWIATGLLAALVALATFLSYAFVYTPLKRITSLSTIVGAVPGALPPLIGWAAARGTLLEPAPWALFLIGFFWQLPHILAIGWMYREDYARAGLPLLRGRRYNRRDHGPAGDALGRGADSGQPSAVHAGGSCHGSRLPGRRPPPRPAAIRAGGQVRARSFRQKARDSCST